jgi:hypothetical protein
MPNIIYNSINIPVLIVDYYILIGLDEALTASGISMPKISDDNIITISDKEYITFDGLIQIFALLGTSTSASLLFTCYSWLAKISFQSDEDKADYLLEFILGRRQAKLPSIN